MPQQPGQRHNIHPLFQGPSGKGMSQAMEVGVGDPRLPDAPLEQVLVGPWLIGLTIFLAEHIAVQIVGRVFCNNGHLDSAVF